MHVIYNNMMQMKASGHRQVRSGVEFDLFMRLETNVCARYDLCIKIQQYEVPGNNSMSWKLNLGFHFTGQHQQARELLKCSTLQVQGPPRQSEAEVVGVGGGRK
jgi:hypothetical protein